MGADGGDRVSVEPAHPRDRARRSRSTRTSCSRARRRSSRPSRRASRSSTCSTTRACGPGRLAALTAARPQLVVARGPRAARGRAARPSICSPSPGGATCPSPRSSGGRARSSSSSASRTPATSARSSGSAEAAGLRGSRRGARDPPTSSTRARCAASAGSVLRIPVSGRVSFEPFARDAKEAGRVLCGAVPSGGEDPFGLAAARRLGARHRRRREPGLPAGAYRYLDRRFTIPMRPPVDSLNAAVAAALLLYASRFAHGRRVLFSEDLRLKSPDARFRLAPGVRAAGPPSAAGLRRNRAAVEPPLRRDLRQEEAPPSASLDDQAVAADHDLLGRPRSAAGAVSTEISMWHSGSSPARRAAGNRGSSNAARSANSATTRVRSPSGESVPMQPRSSSALLQRHEETARLRRTSPPGPRRGAAAAPRGSAPRASRARARAGRCRASCGERRGHGRHAVPASTGSAARNSAIASSSSSSFPSKKWSAPGDLDDESRVPDEAARGAPEGRRSPRFPTTKSAGTVGRGTTRAGSGRERQAGADEGRDAPVLRRSPCRATAGSEGEAPGHDRKTAARLGLVERGAEVLHLAAPCVVAARREADAPKVEPQRPVAGARQGLRGAVDDLVVQRSAVERMRVGEDRATRRRARRPPSRAPRGGRRDPRSVTLEALPASRPPAIGETPLSSYPSRPRPGNGHDRRRSHEEDRPRRRHRHDRRAADRPVHRFQQAPRHRRGHLPQAHADDDRAGQGQPPAPARRQARRRPGQDGRLRGPRPQGRLRGAGGARAGDGRHRLHARRQREQEGLREALGPAGLPRPGQRVRLRQAVRDGHQRRGARAGRGPVPPDRLLQHAQHRRADQDARRTTATAGSALEQGRFVCMRRANDVSQDSGFAPAPSAGKHDDPDLRHAPRPRRLARCSRRSAGSRSSSPRR